MVPFPLSDEEGLTELRTEQERLRVRASALKEVPVTDEDELVDWVVTPEGVRKRT
jgi:hypothetical protein